MKKNLGIFLLTVLVLLIDRSSASYGKTTLEGSSENQKEVFSATSTITGQRESNRQHVKQITEEPYNNNFDAVLADLTKQDGGQHGNVASSNVGLAGYGSEGAEADHESRLREEFSSRNEVGGRKTGYGSSSTASNSGYGSSSGAGYGSSSTGNYDYGSVGPQAGYAPKLRDEVTSGSGVGDLRSGYGSSSTSSSTGYGSASSGNAGYGSSGTPIYDYGSVGPQAGYAPIVRDNESSGRKSGYGVPTSSDYGSSASASSSSSSASGYGTGALNTGYGVVPSNTGYGAVPPKTGYGTIPPTNGYGANVGLRNSIGLNEDSNKNGITYDSQTDLHEGGASIGGGHSYGHSGDNGSGSGSSGGYINRTPNGVSTGYSSHSESSSGYPYPTQSGPPYPYPEPSQNIPGYYPAPPPRAYAPRPQPPHQFTANHPHYQQPQHDPRYHQQPFQHDPLYHQQHDPLYHQQHPIQQYPAPYPHQPQPGYGRLDHRLKTNTEYKEDGHHTGSFNALNGGGAAGNNGCGYGTGFCGGYNGAFNQPGI